MIIDHVIITRLRGPREPSEINIRDWKQQRTGG